MAWSAGISLRGPTGQRGSLAYFTSTAPTDQTASNQDGDFGFAQDSFRFYQRINGTWTAVSTSLKGTDGATGPQGAPGLVGADGSQLLVGMGPPADTLGKKNDVYLNAQNGEVFGPKQDASPKWPDTGYSLRGADGLRGSQIFPGNGPPPSDVSTLSNGTTTGAKPGDLYYDYTNATLYYLS